jgi:hypothetical protein
MSGINGTIARCSPPPHRTVTISQPEHGGNGESVPVVNQSLQHFPADLRAFPSSLSCFRTNCCGKSSVTSDLYFLHLNLFDCATPQQFSPTRGGKEVCNDRDVERGDGPGERRYLSGPCFRRISFQSLRFLGLKFIGLKFLGPTVLGPEVPRLDDQRQDDKGRTTHHCFTEGSIPKSLINSDEHLA